MKNRSALVSASARRLAAASSPRRFSILASSSRSWSEAVIGIGHLLLCSVKPATPGQAPHRLSGDAK